MKKPIELTDTELHAELTRVRQSLEAIRPYRFRKLETRQKALWSEYDARRLSRLAIPVPAISENLVQPL